MSFNPYLKNIKQNSLHTHFFYNIIQFLLKKKKKT
jgi:hypothetical protein